MPSSLSPEPMIGYIDDLDFFKDFKNEFPVITYNDLKSKSDPLIEPSTLGDRLSMIYTGDDGHYLLVTHGGGLHTEEKMVDAGFGAYWQGSERVIPEKRGRRDYWIEISSDRDFLGPASFYVFIQDPVRRLCHRMITCSISSWGQAPKKYLFRHAERRKSGARLSVGHFIGRLAAHFRLVSDQGLRGLSVVASELPFIDLHELERLNFCLRFGDTWAWVAPGLKRQQAAAASAPGAAKDAPVVDEGAQAILAPI
ncbi:hypothetical protein Tco_0236961 [Tanacetum coccineum]